MINRERIKETKWKLKFIDSPVSRRGRSLDERDSRSSSKVVTSSARANTTSTAEVSSNDVSNTVLTDVKPISVIFQPTLFHTRDRSSSHRGHRVPCRDYIFFRFASSIYRIHCARARILFEKLAIGRRWTPERNDFETMTISKRRCATSVLHVNLTQIGRRIANALLVIALLHVERANDSWK